MPVYTKHILSGAGDGHFIELTGIGTGNIREVHNVQATSTNAIESLWLWAFNSKQSADIVFALELISSTTTATMEVVLRQRSDAFPEPTPIFEGLPLTGTDTVINGFMATDTSGIRLHGFVNRIAT